MNWNWATFLKIFFLCCTHFPENNSHIYKTRPLTYIIFVFYYVQRSPVSKTNTVSRAKCFFLSKTRWCVLPGCIVLGYNNFICCADFQHQWQVLKSNFLSPIPQVFRCITWCTRVSEISFVSQCLFLAVGSNGAKNALLKELTQAALDAPPKEVDWVRFPVGQYRRLEKRYLWPVQSRARRWWVGAREQFTRGAATDLPPVRHSLRKQPRGPRGTQAEMVAADHSSHFERSKNASLTRLNWPF